MPPGTRDRARCTTMTGCMMHLTTTGDQTTTTEGQTTTTEGQTMRKTILTGTTRRRMTMIGGQQKLEIVATGINTRDRPIMIWTATQQKTRGIRIGIWRRRNITRGIQRTDTQARDTHSTSMTPTEHRIDSRIQRAMVATVIECGGRGRDIQAGEPIMVFVFVFVFVFEFKPLNSKPCFTVFLFNVS